MALGFLLTSAFLGLFVLLLAADMMGVFRGKNHFPVDGRTIVITGGSQGTGRSAARILAQKGANVLIVARTVQTLKDALEDISAAAIRPHSQRFHYISADLMNPAEGARIISEATAWNNNQPPDIVWCCAGSCHPTLFIDTPIEMLREQMDHNYFSTAYIAHAALQSWLRPSTIKPTKTSPSTSSPEQLPARHLIFTSSLVAFYPVIGYGPYSPGKHALRSLSDTLSQELQLYTQSPEVKIHTVFPGTIFTASLEAEQKIKPAITKKMEEDDGGQQPDEVAESSIKGLERGDEMITTTLLGMALKASALATSKRNGWGVVDTLMSWIMAVVVLFVRRDMDGKVRKWGQVHGSSGQLKE
ncbi:hypothetical protein MMC12_005641 [Toensbergia leucococca]|nr:hypothetical protein [Toensbergia leucococca]